LVALPGIEPGFSD